MAKLGVTAWLAKTQAAAVAALAAIGKAVKPAPPTRVPDPDDPLAIYRRHPDDEAFYNDTGRRREINQRRRDEMSWLKGRGRGWLTRPRERPWW